MTTKISKKKKQQNYKVRRIFAQKIGKKMYTELTSKQNN